jgi:hypothetical protein
MIEFDPSLMHKIALPRTCSTSKALFLFPLHMLLFASRSQGAETSFGFHSNHKNTRNGPRNNAGWQNIFSDGLECWEWNERNSRLPQQGDCNGQPSPLPNQEGYTLPLVG